MPAAQLIIRQAAVLGAGVMGAQIAAHLANAGLTVVLFDLASEGADKSAIARRAVTALGKQEPSPLADAAVAERLLPANYDEDLSRLADCELILEAIAENPEWKAALYARIAPHLGPEAIVATNTSGLSIERLAGFLPTDRRARFLGMHFFNPPRYMPLVELIPGQSTAPALLDGLETWLVSTLGKEVVRAKDTPNFIANRVGVFSFLATFHHTARFGLSFAEVDALTGPLIGRPKSATYRTADVVGLDTFANVIGTMRLTLAEDGWGDHYEVPDWMRHLVSIGHLGDKSGAGVYRRQAQASLIFDSKTGDYVSPEVQVAPEVAAILGSTDPGERMRHLRSCPHPQAQFLWAIFRDIFHYSAVHLAEIAGSARDIDRAMRCGYAWEAGPFELWQAAGWVETANAIAADIAAGKSLSNRPLPLWVGQVLGAQTPAGSWSPRSGCYLPRSGLPAYRRQLFPLTLTGEAPAALGTTLWENGDLRLWTHPLDPEVAICTLQGRQARLSPTAAASLNRAIDHAETHSKALVLWRPGTFCAGIDPAAWLALAEGDENTLAETLKAWQDTALRLKYAAIPCVAALEGKATGTGWMIARHATRRVVGLETQIGHDETALGLIPLAGACAAIAAQTSERAAQAFGNDPFPFLQPAFDALFKGRPARNALAARRQGLLGNEDSILFNTREVLHAAILQAATLADIGHQPPPAASAIRLAGRADIATLAMGLVNLRDGGFISAHDYRIGEALATAICGGAIDAGGRGDEAWLLAVERQQTLRLLGHPLTRERLAHVAKTGKTLRN